MIPHLLLVRSRDKRRFRLTQKKIIRIGLNESADIIVNHPQLYEGTQVLGPGLSPAKTCREGMGKLNFFPSCSWQTDGIRVSMIELKRFIGGILTFFFSLALLVILKGDAFTSNGSQDWTPIPLPARGIYGFCRQDQSHRDGVRLSFETKGSHPYRLFFIAGGKGDGMAITFSMNGVPIDNSVPLPDGWGEETSINLSADKVINGVNIVEIRLREPSTEEPSWGIREVRAVPTGYSNVLNQDKGIYAPESILSSLENSNITGRELARYYETVGSWQPQNLEEISSYKKKTILNFIKEKMRDRLYQVAFEVRSRRIQGDAPAVKQLLKETKGWIPEGWVEGWEIYNGLCR